MLQMSVFKSDFNKNLFDLFLLLFKHSENVYNMYSTCDLQLQLTVLHLCYMQV